MPPILPDYNAPRTLTVELLDPDMLALLRRKTPAEKLAAGHAMWRHARRRLIALLRHEHPNWNETRLKAEIRRRIFGPG